MHPKHTNKTVMEGQKKMAIMDQKMSVSSRKKKAKKEGESKNTVGEATVEVATQEKRRYDADCSSSSSNVEAANDIPVFVANDQHDNEDWRVWLKPGMLVDEQMSWGSVWYSFWDVDANCNAFYSDVMEDDLWDLRSIQHTPQ